MGSWIQKLLPVLASLVLASTVHAAKKPNKEWKYIAVRYPPELQKRVDAGETFKGFEGEELDLPYLTRNSHLGHYASAVNPHYFEADQLYNLKSDPEENENVFASNPEVGQQLKKQLSNELKKFPGRPFGEFTK